MDMFLSARDLPKLYPRGYKPPNKSITSNGNGSSNKDFSNKEKPRTGWTHT
jgi:hypothetical protein